jgi:hypothetical protein
MGTRGTLENVETRGERKRGILKILVTIANLDPKEIEPGLEILFGEGTLDTCPACPLCGSDYAEGECGNIDCDLCRTEEDDRELDER